MTRQSRSLREARARLRRSNPALSLALTVVTGCTALEAEGRPGCDRDNAGLALPPGFCAQVVADSLGASRHLTVSSSGDIYVAIRGQKHPGVIALRDTTGDGVADVRGDFGVGGGNDVWWNEGSLYFATNREVLRWTLPAGQLEPSTPPDTLVEGLIAKGQHAPKTFAVGRDSSLYVMISAPSNTCQVEDRAPGSPGIDPCPWMDSSGGIWRFDSRKTHQRLADGSRFATGVRNVMALAMDPTRTTLYGVQMGRDQLQNNWRDVLGLERGARNPGEEFYRIDEGSDHGWPYCYYDVDARKRLLNPEYGGDGIVEGRCANTTPPLTAFPAHWAPEALLFYSGTSFPEEYRGGVFVSFHGGFNRAPLPEEGFNVVFLPMKDGRPDGAHTVFAEGFRPLDGKGLLRKPMGLAQDVDGSLLVSDDARGRLYRIRWIGQPRKG